MLSFCKLPLPWCFATAIKNKLTQQRYREGESEGRVGKQTQSAIKLACEQVRDFKAEMQLEQYELFQDLGTNHTDSICIYRTRWPARALMPSVNQQLLAPT